MCGPILKSRGSWNTESVDPVISQKGRHVGTGIVGEYGSQQSRSVIDTDLDGCIQPVPVSGPARYGAAGAAVNESGVICRRGRERHVGYQNSSGVRLIKLERDRTNIVEV